MKYTATQRGYINHQIMEPGESFEADDGLKGSWFVPAKEYKPPLLEGAETLVAAYGEAVGHKGQAKRLT